MNTRKHAPNTSEFSKPHTSKSHPETHVDNLHFGENGKRRPDLDVDGITDPGAISYGEQLHKHHQEKKNKGGS